MRIVILLCLFLAACGAPANNNATNRTSTNATPVAAVTPSSAAEAPVTIEPADGVRLVGTLFATDKANSPALLLLHQWQSDRHSYDEFARRMQRQGFTVLSLDGRGFGESTKKADGTTVAPGRTDADVKAMLGDVDSAITFLSKQQNVDPTRIAIVGASYGSSLAIIYAAGNPTIAAVALLSPGLDYFGNMPTKPAVDKFGDRDLFMAAAKEDAESAKAVEGLTTGSSKHETMTVPAGSYHGTDLFKYRDETNGPAIVEDALESFLMTRLGLSEAGHK